jgi:hypothetical protein
MLFLIFSLSCLFLLLQLTRCGALLTRARAALGGSCRKPSVRDTAQRRLAHNVEDAAHAIEMCVSSLDRRANKYSRRAYSRLWTRRFNCALSDARWCVFERPQVAESPEFGVSVGLQVGSVFACALKEQTTCKQLRFKDDKTLAAGVWCSFGEAEVLRLETFKGSGPRSLLN